SKSLDLVTTAFWLQLLEIIWINILLSGDTGVVIALACRSLPERQPTLGVILGSGAFFVLEMLQLHDIERFLFDHAIPHDRKR
ncbi:MAG: hypothetical protein ACREO5_05320, partial [Candidatus Binatia bacterium]